MNLIIYIQLIVLNISILIVIDETNAEVLTKADIQNVIKNKRKHLTGSKDHVVTLSDGGFLAKTNHSIVWKGFYNGNTEVAVKIMWDRPLMTQEMKIYDTLKPTTNENITAYKIPNIYYSGRFLTCFHAIVMTLLDGCLEQRIRLQKRKHQNISELSVLIIFKQAVEALAYLNSKNVVHNDIKPANIFLKGPDVFIADFDKSTIGSSQTEAHTPMFASSGFYLEKSVRTAMDDFESLIISMWYVAGVPIGRPYFPDEKAEGWLLAQCRRKDETQGSTLAELRLKQKCNELKDERVQKVFEQICIGELVSKSTVPNYEKIIGLLDEAIKNINGNLRPAQFEWL